MYFQNKGVTNSATRRWNTRTLQSLFASSYFSPKYKNCQNQSNVVVNMEFAILPNMLIILLPLTDYLEPYFGSVLPTCFYHLSYLSGKSCIRSSATLSWSRGSPPHWEPGSGNVCSTHRRSAVIYMFVWNIWKPEAEFIDDFELQKESLPSVRLTIAYNGRVIFVTKGL